MKTPAHRARLRAVGMMLPALFAGCVDKGQPLAPFRPVAPVLESAVPAQLLLGTDNTVTVTGSGFFVETAWELAAGGGVQLAGVTFVSATEVQLRVVVSATAVPGAVTVKATNPGSVIAQAALLEVVEPSGPKVLSVTPATVLPGTTTTVTIAGENFKPGAHVVGVSGSGFTWGTVTFVSDTRVTVDVTVDTAATPGAHNVTIENPDGRRGTGVGVIAVGTASDPAIFSVSPASGQQGAPALALVVRGANFAAGAVVTFSGSGITVRSTDFRSASVLDVTVDIASSAPLGPRDVTVTNPDLKSATAAGAFAVSSGVVSLSAQVQPILSANCALSGCHAPPSPVLGQDLSAGQTRASTVNVASAESPGELRIAPGSPGASYLVKKLEGTASVGAQMPFGAAPLSAGDIALIRAWIMAGAPNN